MDAQLGRVFDALEASGRDADTIVVFASDNGPVTDQWLAWYEVNAYGSTGGLRGRKHMLYEGGIRVPAIVRYPGVTKPASVSDELVLGTDLFATLAGAADVPVPDDRPIDGIDVTAILRGEPSPRKSAFWALDSVTDVEFAMRRGPWKLPVEPRTRGRRALPAR